MGTYKDQQEFLASWVEDIIRTERRPLLFATFNTHRVIPNEECRSRAERALYTAHRRCFRSAKYTAIPTTELLRVVGSLERGPQTGQPHLHTLLWPHPHALEKFMRVAPERWLRVSPGGHLDVQLVKDVQGSASKLAWYVTKNVDRPELRDGFFTEADLGLPTLGGVIRHKPARSAR